VGPAQYFITDKLIKFIDDKAICMHVQFEIRFQKCCQEFAKRYGHVGQITNKLDIEWLNYSEIK